MKQVVIAFCFFLMANFSYAQEVNMNLFGDYHAGFVLYNRSSGEMINTDPILSSRRLAPCSTFKIYNTLIGLELGLVPGPDEPWYKWDGIQREIGGWNQNLTLREAFRASAVPAFQILARQIGLERMKKFVDQISYGNTDLSAGVDTFWLDRPNQKSILISADEQIQILNRLLDGKLPFAKKNIAVLKDIMKVVETKKGALYGKTGSAMSTDGKGTLGWFVGFLEHNGTTYVFACNITGGSNPSGIKARSIVESILESQALL